MRTCPAVKKYAELFLFLSAQIPSIVIGVFLLLYLLMEYLYTSWSDLGKVIYFSGWIVVVWLGWTIFNFLKIFRACKNVTGSDEERLAIMNEAEYTMLRQRIIDHLVEKKKAASHV